MRPYLGASRVARPLLFPRAMPAFVVVLGILLSLSASSRAFADAPKEESMFAGYTPSSRHQRTTLLPFRFDLHSALTWEADVGAGVRADISIFDREHLQSARDELAISLGADVSFVTFGGTSRITTWPTLAAQWSIAVSDRVSFYPELGIVARIERAAWKGLYPNVAFGGRVQVQRSLHFMGRLGWPIAVSIGLTF